MSQRTDLSPLGWLVISLLYCAQACVFITFLAEHTGSKWYWIGTVFYILLFLYAVRVVFNLNGRARKDEDVRKV